MAMTMATRQTAQTPTAIAMTTVLSESETDTDVPHATFTQTRVRVREQPVYGFQETRVCMYFSGGRSH